MFLSQVKMNFFKPVLVSCSCRRSISVSYTLKRWQKGEEWRGQKQIRKKNRRENNNKNKKIKKIEGEVEGKKWG